MSKRRFQLDLGDYFSSNAKKQTNVDDVTPATEQCKKKHHITFDCEIEQTNTNEINWTLLFNFDFHFVDDSSSNQSIDDQFGEIASSSNLKVHVEGMIASSSSGEQSHNVEVDVRVGEKSESNKILSLKNHYW